MVNLALAVVELWGLCSIAVWLHAKRLRYGLAPMIVYLTSLVSILYAFTPVGAYLQPTEQTVLVLGSYVLVPAILFGLLVVYASDGTAAARTTVISTLGAATVVLGAIYLQDLHQSLPGAGNLAGLPTDHPVLNPRARPILASLVAFTCGIPLMCVSYQALVNRWAHHHWLAFSLALLIGSAVDAVVFHLGASTGAQQVSAATVGLVGKIVATLLVWPIAFVYLGRRREGGDHAPGAADRRNLDLLFGSYRRQEATLRDTARAWHASEDRWRTLVEFAPVCIHEIDLQGHLTGVNPAGLRMLEAVTVDDVIGLRYLDSVAEADQARVGQLLTDAGNGIPSSFEFDVAPASSGRRPRRFASSFIPIPGADGQPTKIMGITEDITDRAQAERTLRESEQRYRSLVDDLPIPILVHANEQVLFANHAAAHDLGAVEPGALQGRSVWDFLLAESPDTDGDYGKVSTVQSSPTRVQQCKRVNGEEFVAEVAGVQVEFDGKSATQVAFRDVTDRQRDQEALRRSEERFQLALEASNDALWEFDPATGHVFRAPRFFEMTGYDPGEFEPNVGAFEAVVHPDDLPRVVRIVKDHLEAGSPYDVEFRLRVKSGAYRWFRDRGQAQWGEDGRPFRMAGSIRDITDRREAEAKRRELEEQLRQAQKLEALGTLAGGIAHDFNNVLAAILGYVELVGDTLHDGHEAQRNVKQIKTATHRGARLVEQILSFARQEPVNLETLEFRAVVGSAADLLRSTLPATIDLQTAFESDTENICGDASQIAQIVMNLGVNGAQAMQNRGQLEIRTDVVDIDRNRAKALDLPRTGPHCRLSVRDTGVGMDTATLERMYDPFFTTKPVGEGTGLGLSVVHGIVKDHDGGIATASELAKGTTFEVYLPVDRSAPAAVENVVDLGSHGGTEKILFVDDDRQIADLGAIRLESLGYRVTVATDPEQALKEFEGAPDTFDLVVTDQAMPKLTGLQLARAIHDTHPGTPVVLLTGLAPSAKEIIDSHLAGMLAKPYQRQDLAATIRTALDAR